MTDTSRPNGDALHSTSDNTPSLANDSAAAPDSDSGANTDGTPCVDEHARSNFLGQRLSSGLSSRLSAHMASPFSRCIFVGMLVLFLLIPLGMVSGVVSDRMHLYQAATDNITDSWGKTQTISGPALIIPFEVWQDKKEKVTVTVNGYDKIQEVVTQVPYIDYKVVLPTNVHFVAEMNPEVRYRGIYRQALYNAPVDVSGAFDLPSESDFDPHLRVIHWDKAYLSVGVTDLKAIAEAPPAVWAGVTLASYKPGANADTLLGAGFHTLVPLSKDDAGAHRTFAFQLRVRGSGGIYFTPVGESTTITMNGTWPAPSFKGNLLPVERTISDQGFSAKWVVSNLTRTYPQMANLSSYDYTLSNGNSRITSFTAGVDLHEPVTVYRMVRRSVEYGILFIAVTFIAMFAFEMVSRQRMHLVQYGMVGLSMSVFYLVLLSLAEHVTFGLAFVAAGGITVVMNSLYVGSVMQSRNKGMIMGGLLTGLYAVLFSLLRMEDFSLIMGTGLVLVMMGALMFVTCKLPQKT